MGCVTIASRVASWTVAVSIRQRLGHLVTISLHMEAITAAAAVVFVTNQALVKQALCEHTRLPHHTSPS